MSRYCPKCGAELSLEDETCPHCNFDPAEAKPDAEDASDTPDTSSSKTASDTDPRGEISFPGVLRVLGWAIIVVGTFAGPISAQPEESYGDPNLVLGWSVFAVCFTSGLLWIALGRLVGYVREIRDSLKE